MPTARLDDRAVIAISGPDAATLLQNVLTTDVPAVSAAGIGYGALLTPQGKIVADLLLHRHDDVFAADVRADEAEAFAKRLGLYRLRSKVTIAAAPDLAVFACWGGGEEEPADPRLAALGRRWVAGKDSVATDTALADYHRHRIGLAIPEGGLDFAFGDAFPHDTAMDSLHGVAFEKGCYIGQEVVSRMRHRGTARRRVVAVDGSDTLPDPGTPILAGDRDLGRLGTSDGRRGIGIARLDRLRAALDAGETIRVGDVAVTITLPPWATYALPEPAGGSGA